MTPSEQATANAISFECKKDSLRQAQSGDWKIAFTVQGIDMDERLTKAFPGTRYVAVLVEIGDDEQPISQPRKEAMPNPKQPNIDAQPQPDSPRSAGTKRDWRELQPAQQAGMRCNEPMFVAFLKEARPDDWRESTDAPECVRLICGVHSRVELGTNQRARMIWKQLDDQYQAWKAAQC